MGNIYYIFRREFRAITADSAVLIFFIGLTLAYPVLYTYIYSEETVFEVPVAVVDHCGSSGSRELVRAWDASPSIDVAARCTDAEEARRLLYRKKVYGLLEIPADFASDLAGGEQAHISLYCDMGALLNYKALLQSASLVAAGVGKKVQVAGLPYASTKQEEVTATPVQMEEVKLFNPQSGYATFIIPAILILVLQQSLLLGVGTLAGTARERSRRKSSLPSNGHYRSAFQVVLGKTLAYLPFYLVMGLWVIVVIPGIFNLTQTGSRWDLFLFLVPFLTGCIFFALTLSFLCKEREMPFLLFVFTSVPLMFMSGISWPSTAIPPFWKAFAYFFPSTHGIEGYVRINTLGSSFGEVREPFLRLCLLAAFYFLLAVLLYRKEIRKARLSLEP